MDNVKLFSNKVWIAEDQSDQDALIAKIIICDFGVNRNGVILSRDTIDTWISTLETKPLVGKIKAKSNGEIDFTSHNVSIVTRTDENGKTYNDLVFNTDAFGTFVSAGIEVIDGVEYIVATAKVWKRFYDASSLIQKRIKEGTLSTSWEIFVEELDTKIINGSLVKIIKKGRFVGHALLASDVAPAYQSSRVLEVASTDEEAELFSAIISDVMRLNNDSNGNEVQDMDKEKATVEVSDNEIEISAPEVEVDVAADDVQTEATGEAPDVEKAELTMRDIRMKMEDQIYVKTERYMDVMFIFPDAKKVWAHVWEEKETDIYEFDYEIQNDEVILSDPIAVTLVVSPRNINSAFDEKNSALIEAQKQINDLEMQISELAPFKEAAEKAALEKAEAEKQEQIAELRKYAEDSGVVTSEELDEGDVHEMIASLNVTELKVLIADRIVQKQKKAKPATETASTRRQAKPRAMLDEAEITEKPGNVLMSWLHK